MRTGQGLGQYFWQIDACGVSVFSSGTRLRGLGRKALWRRSTDYVKEQILPRYMSE